MDFRVFLPHRPSSSRIPVPELAGWQPGPPALSRHVPVERRQPVSLIVPTFFNAELKHRSLHYLLAGVRDSAAIEEIILVSSEGDHRSFAGLKPLAGQCRLTTVAADPHNRGRSRNAGAAAARSPYLLFLDDDMLPWHWRSMDVILAAVLAGRFDCALFPRRQYARFPLLYDPPLLRETIAGWREGQSEAPFIADPLADGAPDLPMTFCFPGCFMLIRRQCFERMGGFSEHYIGWGFEDTEFGLRAMRQLSVLNLFRQAEPLLHIDHPVSPYKTEEFRGNLQKYFGNTHAVDVTAFCRRVVTGENFLPGSRRALSPAVYLKPLKALERAGIPLDWPKLRPWWLRVVAQRLRAHQDPFPAFIVLHGSRGRGGGSRQSDYDVLLLYRGAIHEFHVSEGSPPLELECADLNFFQRMASRPSLNPLSGPMELAKIAQARLLWGDAAEWEAWSGPLLQDAAKRCRAFWLVFALGLRLHAAKHGAMAPRHFASLEHLMRKTAGKDSTTRMNDPDRCSLAALARRAAEALERDAADWRNRLDAGQPLFELQVPEVWAALRFMRRSVEARKDQRRRPAAKPRRCPASGAVRKV